MPARSSGAETAMTARRLPDRGGHDDDRSATSAGHDARSERQKMMDGDLYLSFAPKGAELEADRAKSRVKLAVRLARWFASRL